MYPYSFARLQSRPRTLRQADEMPVAMHRENPARGLELTVIAQLRARRCVEAGEMRIDCLHSFVRRSVGTAPRSSGPRSGYNVRGRQPRRAAGQGLRCTADLTATGGGSPLGRSRSRRPLRRSASPSRAPRSPQPTGSGVACRGEGARRRRAGFAAGRTLGSCRTSRPCGPRRRARRRRRRGRFGAPFSSSLTGRAVRPIAISVCRRPMSSLRRTMTARSPMSGMMRTSIRLRSASGAMPYPTRRLFEVEIAQFCNRNGCAELLTLRTGVFPLRRLGEPGSRLEVDRSGAGGVSGMKVYCTQEVINPANEFGKCVGSVGKSRRILLLPTFWAVGRAIRNDAWRVPSGCPNPPATQENG